MSIEKKYAYLLNRCTLTVLIIALKLHKVKRVFENFTKKFANST